MYFLLLKVDFETMCLEGHSSPATFSLAHCTFATLIISVFLEHAEFIPSLRPLYHSSLCLECSSLLSLPGWFFILILVLAQKSLSMQSLTSCPVTLFQGFVNYTLGARAGHQPVFIRLES